MGVAPGDARVVRTSAERLSLSDHQNGPPRRGPATADGQERGPVSIGARMEHTVLRCPDKRCRGQLVILPGAWRVGRPLQRFERVPEHVGRGRCDGCGQHFEIHPARAA